MESSSSYALGSKFLLLYQEGRHEIRLATCVHMKEEGHAVIVAVSALVRRCSGGRNVTYLYPLDQACPLDLLDIDHSRPFYDLRYSNFRSGP